MCSPAQLRRPVGVLVSVVGPSGESYTLWLAGLQLPGGTEKLGLDELKHFLSQV